MTGSWAEAYAAIAEAVDPARYRKPGPTGWKAFLDDVVDELGALSKE